MTNAANIQRHYWQSAEYEESKYSSAQSEDRRESEDSGAETERKSETYDSTTLSECERESIVQMSEPYDGERKFS